MYEASDGVISWYYYDGSVPPTNVIVYQEQKPIILTRLMVNGIIRMTNPNTYHNETDWQIDIHTNKGSILNQDVRPFGTFQQGNMVKLFRVVTMQTENQLLPGYKHVYSINLDIPLDVEVEPNEPIKYLLNYVFPGVQIDLGDSRMNFNLFYKYKKTGHCNEQSECLHFK